MTSLEWTRHHKDKHKHMVEASFGCTVVYKLRKEVIEITWTKQRPNIWYHKGESNTQLYWTFIWSNRVNSSKIHIRNTKIKNYFEHNLQQ